MVMADFSHSTEHVWNMTVTGAVNDVNVVKAKWLMPLKLGLNLQRAE